MKLFGFVVMLLVSMAVSDIYVRSEIISMDQQLKLLGAAVFCWLLTFVLGHAAWMKFRSNLAKRREGFDRSSKKPSFFASLWDRDEHGRFWSRPPKL